MKFKFKGGPGSGRRPEGGSNKPRVLNRDHHDRINPNAGGGHLNPGRSQINYTEQPNKPGSAGIPFRTLFPHGRNPDGTPRTSNDPKPASKPKPKK